MNNKRLGTAFEQEFCKLLADAGYWVHFIAPDNSGAQPFDIIAVRYGISYAFDCKTCESDTFNISRLEDNQIMAFEKWLKCGNSEPMIVIKHKGRVYFVMYTVLKTLKSVKIERLNTIEVVIN
jgi:Holliday junction resolvase